MSWESVVDDHDAPQSALLDEDDAAARPLVSTLDLAGPLTPEPIAPLVSPVGTGPTTIEPITFAPLTLDLGSAASAREPAADTAPRPLTLDEPLPIRFAPLVATPAVVAPDVVAPAVVEPAVVEPAVVEPAVVTPAVVEPEVVPPAAVAPAPSAPPPDFASTPEPAPEAIAVPSLGVPEIVEATPVPESTHSAVVDGATVDVYDGSAGLAALATSIRSDAGPQLPAAPAPSRQPAAAMSFETNAPERPRIATSKGASTRRGRRSLKLVLALVVLAGLVGAGIVFGRPYLLPGDWDAATKPYAGAVETARGVEFVESLAVIAEPTPLYTERMSAELTGAWTQEQTMWRALGLMRGPSTEASVAEGLAGWQDATYSSVDGQVYRDEAVAGPQSDAQITEAMTAASLDQEFGWSIEQPNRTLDDAAQTLAEVRRQSRDVLADSPFAVGVEPEEPAILALLPPVIGYRVLAPAVFAEFENTTATAENVLGGIGVAGPGPMASEVPVLASNPTMIGTDTVVGSPRAMDRSFWYLVFSGFLDPRSAYNASEAVVESAVTMAERGATQCAYATFSGGDTEQTAILRSALETWSTAAAPTLSSVFSVLPDGTLQIVGCDPGVGFDTPTRLGASRELVGWRMAELATLEAIADVEGTPADFEALWAVVEASDVPVQLAGLAPETSPKDAAAQARAAVGALLTPAG